MKARRYSIHVDGYEPEVFVAPTASKARYRAFKAFTDAVPRMPFLDFLRRITTLHLGAA